MFQELTCFVALGGPSQPAIRNSDYFEMHAPQVQLMLFTPYPNGWVNYHKHLSVQHLDLNMVWIRLTRLSRWPTVIHSHPLPE